jgi:hypothetical protein
LPATGELYYFLEFFVREGTSEKGKTQVFDANFAVTKEFHLVRISLAAFFSFSQGNNYFPRQCCRVLNRCLNVPGLKGWVLLEDFFFRHPFGEAIKDDGYHDPSPLNADFTVANIWICGYTTFISHLHSTGVLS